jgi:hypothetical protein
MTFDLDQRTGWPPDFRFLLERYPRAVWPTHANLGELSRFWLAIHGNFRELGSALQTAALAYREGEVPAAEFRPWFERRLSYFLGGLEGHHTIEDFQFFPVFGAAEPRLGKGFEVLERDHITIHQSMTAAADAATAFLAAAAADKSRMAFAADDYVKAGELLLKRLVRHLDDEEDLIIPLILDRGEAVLGV